MRRTRIPLALAVLGLAALVAAPGLATPARAALALAVLGSVVAIRRGQRVSPVLLHDPLTGVLSRDAFRVQVDRLSMLAGEERPAALLLLRVDERGEGALRCVAGAMRRGLRTGDVVGRVGEDELAVFAFAAHPDRLAGRLLELLRAEGCGATAGLARCPRDGDDSGTLIGAADIALRTARRDADEPFTIYGGAPLAAHRLTGSREALLRICAGEGLTMLVQPIVDLQSTRVHAYEALVRFSARNGETEPGHWFRVADQLGLRRELERACLEQALALLEGLPPRALLSVNLPATMLDDTAVLALLEGRPGLDRLVIEVSADNLADAPASVEAAIGRLRAAGVRFAVDDVRAGYAGFGRLAVVRPSYLKLDRELVRGIDEEADRAGIVGALVNYARETGCRVVAEGVETAGELDAVRATGIDLVQGFLLGAPRPPWPVAGSVRTHTESIPRLSPAN
jgi:EAL domain-containing protein (putative c-di-GMP-specific phosphodiesterase class I)/GGDEF domain-containing protein